MSAVEKKTTVINRMISAVEEYFGAFGQPMPVRALSARFGKALASCGGFPETLEELRRDG